MKAIFFFSKLKETEKNKKQLIINRMDRIGIKGNHKLEWNEMEWNPFLFHWYYC
jgi:hypothetical protein